MKKWYQSCGWILVAALALELSGCANGSGYLSRFTGRKDDQKLVDVDGKTKSKKGSSTAKKSDSLRDKASDSQLAKSTKPKVQSRDDAGQAIASKERAKPAKRMAARESMDPFESPELKDLGSKVKKSESDFAELADKGADSVAKATTKAAHSAADRNARVQEVGHKVEDNLADLGDVPEWAAANEADISKDLKKGRDMAKAAAVETGATLKGDFDDIRADVRKKLKEPAPAASDDRPASTDLASLCPDAQGELREMVSGLKESDTEGLKRGVHRIGRMGPDAKAAAPALIHLLKHKDGFVRTHAALALARMQASPPEAVQTVVDGLKSKSDPGLRSFAAAVLAEMGPQAGDALSTLADSLKDQDGYVRLHAAEVLIRYDRWAYPALETLLGCLSDKDGDLRWLATYSLAELAPESQETVDALIKATRDPVAKVKVGAVFALGEIGPFAKSASGELQKLADSTTNQDLQSAVLFARQQIDQ